LRHAGVGIAREDGHRPFVVAGPLLRIPSGGVAGAVVDEIELRIVRIPSPRIAAADLPLIALPGLQAGIGADRLAERRGFLGVYKQVGVRAFGIGAPDLLAVLHRIGGNPAAHTELTAGYADIDLVLDDHRRFGAGRAFARIIGLHRPHDLAGLGV